MKVKIVFNAKFKKIKPKLFVGSENNSFNVELEKQTVFEEEFDLVPKDTLLIEFLNKCGVEDNIVFIKSIEIDGINLQHYIYDGTFFPEYDQDWLQKQTVTPPNFYKPCTELRVKGEWKLGITTPIWKMIMEKWLHDDR